MYPLISDICLLSAARYFKVIAMKDDLIKSVLYKFWHMSTRGHAFAFAQNYDLWGFYWF